MTPWLPHFKGLIIQHCCSFHSWHNSQHWTWKPNSSYRSPTFLIVIVGRICWNINTNVSLGWAAPQFLWLHASLCVDITRGIRLWSDLKSVDINTCWLLSRLHWIFPAMIYVPPPFLAAVKTPVVVQWRVDSVMWLLHCLRVCITK